MFWLVGLWALMLYGAGVADNGYGSGKALKFFSITLLAALAPPILIRDAHDARRFFNALLLVGVIVCANALSNVGQLGQYDRLTAFDANTIALGRGVGLGLLLALVLWLNGAISGWASFVLLVPLSYTLIASGSRGPLFAVVTGLLPSLIYSFRRASGVRRAGSLMVILLGLGTLALPFIPRQSLSRIQTTLSGDLDRSSSVRAEAIQYTPPQIANYPMGVGFGGFEEYVALSPSAAPISYPHNVFLEVGLEAGWLPLGGLIGLLLLAMWRSGVAIRSGQVTGALALALLLFALVNSSVSGDINDNKLLWAALGLGLAVHALPTTRELFTHSGCPND